MKCKRLRKRYFKYLDGRLSEKRSKSLKEHICDCPDCAAEANSVEKMRSLLHKAGKPEMPDTYWDTYWERLEGKLPDKPLQINLGSRVSNALADMVRQPAVLGRIAVYVLLVALVIHIRPDKLVHISLKSPERDLVYQKVHEEIASFSESEALGEVEQREPSMTTGSQLPEMGRFEGVKKPETDLNFAYSPPESLPKKVEIEVLPRTDEGVIVMDRSSTTEEAALALETPVIVSAAPSSIMRGASTVSVIEIDKEFAEAESYFEKGDYNKAIPAYQNFLAANLKNVDDDRVFKAAYQIGESYYQIGNYKEAVSNFAAVAAGDLPGKTDAEGTKTSDTKAVSKQEENKDKAAEATAIRARKAVETKERQEESEVVAKRVASEQNGELARRLQDLMSQAMFRLAESYERLGDKKQALEIYNKYIQKYPQGKQLQQANEKMTQINR